MFRPLKGSRSTQLTSRRISEDGMDHIVRGYLSRLPGAIVKTERQYEEATERGVYSTHSLRATTATLLLDAGVDICKVQELLGHKHITTTQIYDKRRRLTSESASHDMPI